MIRAIANWARGIFNARAERERVHNEKILFQHGHDTANAFLLDGYSPETLRRAVVAAKTTHAFMQGALQACRDYEERR